MFRLLMHVLYLVCIALRVTSVAVVVVVLFTFFSSFSFCIFYSTFFFFFLLSFPFGLKTHCQLTQKIVPCSGLGFYYYYYYCKELKHLFRLRKKKKFYFVWLTVGYFSKCQMIKKDREKRTKTKVHFALFRTNIGWSERDSQSIFITKTERNARNWVQKKKKEKKKKEDTWKIETRYERTH